MSDDGNDDLTYTVLVEKETAAGLRVSVVGSDWCDWLPKSQCGKYPKGGEQGTLVLPRWLALDKGMPGPVVTDEPAGEDWRSDADERPSMDLVARLDLYEADLAKLMRRVHELERRLEPTTATIDLGAPDVVPDDDGGAKF